MLKFILIVLIAICASTSVLAQEKQEPNTSTETRAIWSYQAPNRGIGKLLPDISLIGTFAGAYFSEDPTGDVGHDPARTGFTLQEIEVAFQSIIDPYLRADVFLSFHEDGVELEEGYATTLSLPKGLQVRAGKMLLPFGRQNQKHLEIWDFADNMLATKYLLGTEGLSEIGVEGSYLFPLPFFLQLQGTFTNGDNDTNFNGNRKEDFLYNARLVTSFDLNRDTTILIGGSGAWGFNDTGLGNKTNIYGGDLLLKWKPKAYRSLVWQSEYLYRRFQTAGDLNQDGGFYSYLDYQFFKRWHAGLRYDHVGFPDDSLTQEWRITPALTFNPTEFSRLKLQYEYDKPENVDAVHVALLQLEFSMGPHGAHAF